MAENNPNLLKNSIGKQGKNGLLKSISGNEVRCSLPCNVNSGETARDFLEEAKRSKEMKDKDYMIVDIEKERLIENDLLARGYEERLIDGGGSSGGLASAPSETHIASATPKYTSKATLHIQPNRASNVDDPIPLGDLDGSTSDKKAIDTLTKAVQNSKYQVIIPTYSVKATGVEEKKVDENGNALHQTKEKKKKKQFDKNVVVLQSENIQGHKSEIINNVDQLLQFIEGRTDHNVKTRSLQSKTKQLHKQHTSEDGGSKTSKKRHTKSGGKESGGNVTVQGRHELKKSNSLGEISGIKLDRDFEAFSSGKNKQEKEEENVVLRGNKPSIDRVRERRSWGNVEPHSYQTLYNASSMENLETSADNWEVTRPKKKSKKRRNSVSSTSGARQTSSMSGVSSSISNEDRRSRRVPSPDLGVIVGVSNAKTTRSMPHSEKSNDSSSDVDSVHSLPMDGPISYADIAKNSEKKKPSPEKQERPIPANKEKSPQPFKQPEQDSKNCTVSHIVPQLINSLEKSPTPSVNPISLSSNNSMIKVVVPDVHNFKSFPAITGSTAKNPVSLVMNTLNPQTHNVTLTSDKAVQSTFSYEETFVLEKLPVASQHSYEVHSSQKPAASVASQSSPIELSQVEPVACKRQSTPIFKENKETRMKTIVPAKESVLSQPDHSVQDFFESTQGDIPKELAFFSQLMGNSAQYATQQMPPDIMEVSAIEKMQFMNCSGANSLPVTPKSTSQNSTQVSYVQSPPSTAAISSEAPTQQGGTKCKRKKGVYSASINAKGSSGSVSDSTKGLVEENVAVVESVCDSSSEEKGDCSGIVNGISDETMFSSPEPLQQSSVTTAPQLDSPPAVVMLSHTSKEVPSGLVFGFDINEQLLLEHPGSCGDAATTQQQLPNSTVLVSRQIVSENNVTEVSIGRLPCRGEEWVKRYKPPSNDRGPAQHNHDKIVTFISAAWEDILNQQISYYSDSL